GSIEAATAALAHRGPDDRGVEKVLYSGGVVALGNCRLAIQDLSVAGHMPMQDLATGNWITFNGEIYNFRELKQDLIRAGASFASDSDTEVVMKGYARHGLDWFRRLRGMFAAAIFDAVKQELLVVRDRFGIKPLYYAQRGQTLYFASEVRALLRAGAVERRINPVGLYQFLTFGSVSDPETMIQGVYSLPAGHCLRSDGAGVEIKPYWTLAEAFAPSNITDFDVAKTTVAELVRDSIRKHIVSDVPVSLFLSGGIDSSVIALALRQMEVAALHSFSVVCAEADHSEAEDAKLVAQQAGTTHHEIMLQQQDVLRDLPAMIAAMDQPSFDGVNSYVISAAVRKAGYKVALSGLGGDEVFAGYSIFTTAPKLDAWQRRFRNVPGPLRSLLGKFSGAASGSEDQKRKLHAILQEPFHPAYGVLRMMFLPEMSDRLAARHEQMIVEQALAPLHASLEAAKDLDAVNRISYLEISNYMRNTLLRDTDSMSMASSLEVRVPFIDHELIGYVAGLAGRMKMNGMNPKSLLTAAFADVLPPQVVHKTKQGFTLPFRHWLRADLKPALEESFATVKSGALADHLNAEAVSEVWDSFQREKTSWSRPWSLFVLQRWCQYNLE
ncbi:MAG TPA: asparagine synthase (glutamine-hydrolyzing), partial [Terriglobales bacterium]|nr:asparagine synthase (glutamine-hydrolyzing) [Terriglobales bacterium]